MPTAADAMKQLIHYYVLRHRVKEAAPIMKQYLQVYPDDFDYACHAAGALALHGQYAEAMTLLEPVVAREKNYERYITLGEIFHELGNNARAAELAKAAIPLDPDNWPAYLTLAEVYKAMGRAEDAIAMFEKVKQYRPNFPEMDENIRALRQTLAAQASTKSAPGEHQPR
jgi:tetratricopeptide (TPR) repeat protein